MLLYNIKINTSIIFRLAREFKKILENYRY